ncbi:MAG: efflux RND transporter permease subunit [Deltaproteobacteria bacterium]|nr:efflux RND transporter permease subunit [Deltaproteobacteria bacterium]
MFERIIRAAARNGFLVCLAVLTAAGAGILGFSSLRRDVFPDLSAPLFNIIVQNAAMGTEELETAIAIPLEAQFTGLPGARRVRSTSQLGVTQVTVEFDPDADYQRSRQYVVERLANFATTLTPGTEPPLLSGVTGRLNEIMEVTLRADEGASDLMALRDLAEFDVGLRLAAVPGVATVERLGGWLREYQVDLDTMRMNARHVSLAEVLDALESAGGNTSGGFLVRGPTELGVRAVGRPENEADLKKVVVAMAGDVAITLGEVADVHQGPAVRRGVAHSMTGEVVSLRIVKQFGSDTVKVAAGVRDAIAGLASTLPAGTRITVDYDQSTLIEQALSGVGRAVLIGGVFVVFVLFLLLGDARAALLVTLTIPLSLALAGLLLDLLGIGLNTMTLGGLAIAVGLLVDASIIVVENVVTRIHDAHDRVTRRRAAIEAAVEVGRPIAFATLIIISVFLPLFGMSGIEGRMYGPLAASVIASMAGALVLALTLTPVTSGLVLRPHRPGKPEDVALLRVLKRGYAPVLDWCLRHWVWLSVISLGVTVPALFVAAGLGSDFMPEMDEGALLIQTNVPAEASLLQVDLLNHKMEDILRSFPEVKEVVRRTGRSEKTEDPMPHTLSDVLVVLDPDKRSGSTEELGEAMREKLEKVPGLSVFFTTPLGMRIDEGLGGSPADIQVKIFGHDLDTLSALGDKAQTLLGDVQGLKDLRVESQRALPELRVTVDRDAAGRFGVNPGRIVDALRVGLVGQVTGEIWQGKRRYDVVARLDPRLRGDPSAIRALPVDRQGESGSAARVPLGQVARIEETVGPAAVRRESGSRRIAVEASVVDRDLGGAAREVADLLHAKLDMPTGYFFVVGGKVESQERASGALTMAIGAALFLVFALLVMALGSAAEALVILTTLPVAAVGGVAALAIAGATWNVSSLVGLLGLFGIAVQNSLVLVTQTKTLLAEGRTFEEAIREASIGRVRPKLMTALTAILGLLPMLLLDLHGVEIERPLAMVMVGGLLTSTLFTLFVLPVFYGVVYRLRARLAPKTAVVAQIAGEQT